MIRFLFRNGVELSLATSNAESPVAHRFKGSRSDIQKIKGILYKSYNMFGHHIAENSPAIDLAHVFYYSKIKAFDGTKTIEGENILRKWDQPVLSKGEVF